MTKMYLDMDYHIYRTNTYSNCVNASAIPCWVPQMKDIVASEVQNNLDKCPTIMDYNCEKLVLWNSMIDVASMCPKPCKRLYYKLIEKEELQVPKEHDWVNTVHHCVYNGDVLTIFLL